MKFRNPFKTLSNTHNSRIRLIAAGLTFTTVTLTGAALLASKANATSPIIGLGALLLPACKPAVAGENCSPVEGWGSQRKISDARIDRIAAACDLSKRRTAKSFISWETGDTELSISAECRKELLSILPIDSQWPKTTAGRIGMDNFINSLLITLMIPSVASNEEQIASILGEEELGCDIYEMDVLQRRAPSELPYDLILKSGEYPLNRELFRYMVERTKKYYLYPERLDQIAWESEGNIFLTGHFSRSVTFPPVSTLVHEARHLDYGGDDGAPHIVCDAPEMENQRSCDADITGANGLEAQFIDGLLRASQNYQIEMSDGKIKALMSKDNQRLLLLELCATVKFKFNKVPERLRRHFDSVESCLKDIWQDREKGDAILEEIYGFKE
jgi:hypothetical protein